MTIHIKHPLKKKKYYEQSDFAPGTFKVMTEDNNQQSILKGEFKGRRYETYVVVESFSLMKRILIGMTAFVLTVVTLGFGLKNPNLRAIWSDAWNGKAQKTIKVLTPANSELSTQAKTQTALTNASLTSNPSPTPSVTPTEEIFATLKKQLDDPKRTKDTLRPLFPNLALQEKNQPANKSCKFLP